MIVAKCIIFSIIIRISSDFELKHWTRNKSPASVKVLWIVLFTESGTLSQLSPPVKKKTSLILEVQTENVTNEHPENLILSNAASWFLIFSFYVDLLYTEEIEWIPSQSTQNYFY